MYELSKLYIVKGTTERVKLKYFFKLKIQELSSQSEFCMSKINATKLNNWTGQMLIHLCQFLMVAKPSSQKE